MPDLELIAWNRGGWEARMERLAPLESRIEAALNAISNPATPHQIAAIVGPAEELRQVASEGLEWLKANPSPNAGVNVAFRKAWTSYVTTMVALLRIGGGSGTISAQVYARRAGDAWGTAQRENWDATMAFVKAVGP